MTQEERNELGQIIGAMAIYFGRQDITRPVVSMFLDDIEQAGLSFAEALGGYTRYRQSSKSRRFPIPADIIELCRPQASDESLAKEAAGRILDAITRFGYMRGDEAQIYIGSLGWSVVKSFGGWRNVCENHGVEFNALTFQAQARELAKSHLELNRIGILGSGPQLPEPPNNDGTRKLSSGLTGFAEVISLNLPKKPEGA